MTKTLKVIFLDFDGVLNTYEYLVDGDRQTEGADWDAIDPKAVARLNEIIRQTDAHVVFSTSWRHNHTENSLFDILRKRGFNGYVLDSTPIHSWSLRGNEVQAWLDGERHKSARDVVVESFVVLDDLNEFPSMTTRHIRTEPDCGGLLDAHISEAVRILNTPLSGKDEVRILREVVGA